MINASSGRHRVHLCKQSLYWLVLLGPLFLISYGLINQFTATRHDVGHFVFGWEQAIPFMPWTIVPYWSIDLLYAISLFICTSHQELKRHAYRLMTATFVACAGFLLFPLQFSFTRPETQGLFGWLFHQLEQFDLPYNQAPSLHIILAWLLWLRFRQHTWCRYQPLLSGWFLLIGVSVLTTWQHHVIDVCSGLIIGIIISYLIPIKMTWHWYKPTAPALIIAAKYSSAGLFISLIGIGLTPYSLPLLWPACALFIVAAGYAGLGAGIFQKNNTGQLSLSARILLWPYLVAAKAAQYWFSRHLPDNNLIHNGIALGHFRYARTQRSAVLDLTAEFHRIPQPDSHWYSYPLMDLVAPTLDELQQAVATIRALHRTHHDVIVCCALGLSRSAVVAAAWLLAERHAFTVDQAAHLIKLKRPQIVLTPAHIRLLETFRKTQCSIPD